MGYFTNLLPLYVEVDPAQSFADAVKAVKAMVLDSFANPDIRLEDLVRELSLRSVGGGGDALPVAVLVPGHPPAHHPMGPAAARTRGGVPARGDRRPGHVVHRG